MSDLSRHFLYSFRYPALITTGLLLAGTLRHASAAIHNATIPPELTDLGVTSIVWDDSNRSQIVVNIGGSAVLAEKMGLQSMPASPGTSPNVVVAIEGSSNWSSLAELNAELHNSGVDGEFRMTLNRGTPLILTTRRRLADNLTVLGLRLIAPAGSSVIVDRVDGLSEQAGVNKGDQIQEIDGQIPDSADYSSLLIYRGMATRGFVTLLLRPRGASDASEDREVVVPQRSTLPSSARGIQSTATGPHITFPEYISRGRNSTPVITTGMHPSLENEVISARVELYYYRDAHRVAQLINRTARSYNAAAVSLHERAAEDAREISEAAKSRRREAEFRAEKVAQDLRQKKSELARMVGELRLQLTDKTNQRIKLLEQKQSREDDRKRMVSEQGMLQARKDAIENDGVTDNNTEVMELRTINQRLMTLSTLMSSLDTEISSLQTQSDNIKLDLANSQSTVQNLVRDVSTLEEHVSELKLKEQQAVEAEEKAAKDQFRREVSAAKADPDTYAPGDPNSIDPVSQVSISVIGEGVLHLRGPRAGVVRIREMIDQIDHPVGQVKIGIMTVQINGESGARMDNTLRRMEGHLSRGRFLAYVSEQLFKRSVSEVSARVAARHLHPEGQSYGPPTVSSARLARYVENDHRYPDASSRWRAYLTEFYGEDFLKELSDVYEDSAVLDPFNKLISLSSADSMTLAEAMFVTALAKAEYRHEICERFNHYLCCELPVLDARWVETNRIKKGWDPRWWDGTCCKPNQIIAHGQKTYRFDAIQSFFKRTYADPHASEFEEQHWLKVASDRMNAMQREVVKLTQGLTIEQAVRFRRQALIEKKAVVLKTGHALLPHELQIVDSEIATLTDQHLAAMESLRGRKAAIDRLIKQAVIAMEDDVYAQFYNPALERIRGAAEEWDVELGSVERTTVLTNNRAFGKVAPQATYEFDLPKRDILVAEALKAAYAMHKDLGPLLADPEFATLAKMFSGQSLTTGALDGRIQNVLPSGSENSADQQYLLQADESVRPQFGTELEKLIPDPAIYKFETGTGFDVRPVVQPDGQSVVFDFNYMYTTDLLEPTSPDERNLGRVKRHFVNTEVQLGNLEWREISRYEVSLKAARNARGVPLLEDIPIAGLAFRPLPQAKKSIQKNIIVGQAAIYPTIQDLLGLKPSEAAQFDLATTAQQFEQLYRQAEQRSQNVEDILNSRLIPASCPPPAAASSRPSGSGTGDGIRSEAGPRIPALPEPQPRLEFVPGTSSYTRSRTIQPVEHRTESFRASAGTVFHAASEHSEVSQPAGGSRKPVGRAATMQIPSGSRRVK